MTADPRAEAVERLLREAGLRGGRARVLGPEGEIAALALPAWEWERLRGDEGREIAERVKALGFRYVALDLEPESGRP